MHLSITEQQFCDLAADYNVIPVSRHEICDLDTPVSLYLKAGGFKLDYSFLLESVVGGESRGRFSIIGLQHQAVVYGRDGQFFVKDGEGENRLAKNDPIFALEEVFEQFKAWQPEEISGFHSGAVGFFAYDIIRYYERINLKEEFDQSSHKALSHLPDPLGVNDMVYVFPRQVILFDHAKGSLTFIENVYLKNPEDAPAAYKQAVADLEALEEKIRSGGDLQEFLDKEHPAPADKQEWQVNTSEEEYTEMVEAAREYMKAGDIFQTVLSKRFYREYKYDPFLIYRALRVANPSPYMFYLNFPGEVLIGSSPEILVQKVENEVLVRPIAGTARRGKDEKEDQQLADTLLADKKEIAEHVMLVDLGRNDVGRISQPGSVEVTEMMIIEKYSHVMHIVSNVIGKLQSKYNAFSALWATLPAGTVSGAPKVRAMQIIEELEKEVRGVYSGCIGYFGFDKNMDSAIALRTMLVRNETLYVQAGAGLVYDSDPLKENEECFKKAQALFRAVELVFDGEIR